MFLEKKAYLVSKSLLGNDEDPPRSRRAISMRVSIFGHEEEQTTARYFYKYAHCFLDGSVTYNLNIEDLEKMEKDDIFFFIDPPPSSGWPRGFENLKCPSIAYLIDVHRGLEERLEFGKFFDFIFLAQKDYLPFFKNAGFKHVYWLPFGCDPSLYPLFPCERNLDVAFVGQMDMKGSRRQSILARVLPKFSTNDYLHFYSPIKMAEIYSRAKIVFNVSIGGDLNMRIFEAMASGALLVTDRIQNGMDDLFQEGVHFVGYSDCDEAIEKIRFYLLHEKERNHIASTAKELVLSKHTYAHRWNDIKLTLEGNCQNRFAPIRSFSSRDSAKAYIKIYTQLADPLSIWGYISPAHNGCHGLAFFPNWFMAMGRRINQRFPITPRALKNFFMRA